MEKNNYIESNEFEELIKDVNPDKYQITKELQLIDNKLIVSKWEIFNKSSNTSNIVFLASYKGNNKNDILNLIKKDKKDSLKIEIKIFNKLIELGIPINGKSITYWKYILKKIYDNRELQSEQITQLYSMTAEKFNSTYGAVERCLRYATHKMKSNIIKEYNLPKNAKITNGTIINFFVENIFNQL